MTMGLAIAEMDAQSDRIRLLEPINQLDRADQDAIIEDARLLSFPAGSTIYTEGTDDNYANYLLDGTVEVLWNNRQIRVVDSRDKTANQALDSAGTKRFTVKSLSDSTVFQVGRSRLEKSLLQVEITRKLSSLRTSDPRDARWAPWKIRLLGAKMFKSLPLAHIQETVACFEQISAGADEIVAQQGKVGGYFFIIGEGECLEFRQTPGNDASIHATDLYLGKESAHT